MMNDEIDDHVLVDEFVISSYPLLEFRFKNVYFGIGNNGALTVIWKHPILPV